MKKVVAIVCTTVLVVAGSTAWASMDMDHSKGQKDSHSHDPMSGKMLHMEHEDEMKGSRGMMMRKMNIDGYKVSFHIMDIYTYIEKMGHEGEMLGNEATHHIMMEITDKNGKKVENAVVRVRVIDSKNKSQAKTLMSMMGNYGANFNMPEKGKYQIMTLFKIDGKKHKGGYWHTMK